MPKRKVRTYYPAVTGSVILVGLVGLTGAILRQFIPKPALNSMANEADSFLVAAATQSIQWRPLNAESLAEARREDKPILLVVGDASNQAGFLADDFGFVDSELSDSVRRNFIPIRVDATAQPYVAAAMDPISRSRDGWDPGYQIWFMTPEAKGIGALVSTSPVASNLQRSLGGSINYYLDLLGKLDRLPPNVGPPGESQRAQATLLIDSLGQQAPRSEDHLQWLTSNRAPDSGSWNTASGNRLQPSALRFLLNSGTHSDLTASLEPIAASGIIDWINGGFFSQARAPGWHEIDFEKVATLNADMSEICAQAGLLLQSRLYRRLAEDSFDCLTKGFALDGIIRAYRFDDRSATNRSSRSSFSPRFLVDHFDDNSRRAMESSLGLNPRENPEMLPHLGSISEFSGFEPELDHLLSVMRESKRQIEETYSNHQVASIASYSVARLLTVAKLLEDPKRTRTAVDMYRHLAVFRSGANDVVRRADGLDIDPAYLGDYLGYADAALQYFLLTGDPLELKDGLAVLNRALEFFGGPPGVLLNTSPENRSDLPSDMIVPEVVDGDLPSTSSLAIRLTIQYSWALDSVNLGKASAQSTALREFARSSAFHYGEIANQNQRGFSSFFYAADLLEKGRYFRVSGPNALLSAWSLSRTEPRLTVVPVVRPGTSTWEMVVGDRAITYPDETAARIAVRQFLTISQ